MGREYPGFEGRVERLASESTPWWPPSVTPPDGAPNVVLVLLDDMGFSDIGPFGSEIPTPTLDRLAAGGLRYANYHTAPLCSPARAAIQTGLNPHKAGFASVSNFDPGFPGWTMEISPDVRTLPEVLRASGYATYAVGKWHLTRDATMHDGAARASWPLQRGFDRFYGILEGLTNLHHPHRLVSDNSPVEVDEYPEGYYFTDDITDRAISFLKSLRAHDATKPFFLYLAHAAVHGPLQAKADDIARHHGRYGDGWDALREQRFARQLEIGLFPEGTALSPRNHEPGHDVRPWADLPADEQALFARYQEVYAAMVDNVDQNLARLLATIELLGDLDNTVVLFTSDNGGTEEGGERGSRSYFKQFGGPSAAGWELDVPRDPDLIGGPQTLVHYPKGWGMASNTPFRLYKAGTHAGGVRVPFVVSWPAGIPESERGRIRHQYQYVNDLLPTILDLAHIADPGERDGRSFAPSIRDGSATSTHLEQYSECLGNRSFYREGWKLVTLHGPGTPFDDGSWELYDLTADPTETTDLSAERPDKVRELADAWEQAAWDNAVFPLDDGAGLLLRRRPQEAAFREPVTLLPGTPSLERYRSQRLVAFRSFTVEVRLEHETADQGVLVAHGDQGGGYSLFVEDGRLHFAYNQYGELRLVDAGPLPAGSTMVGLRADAGPDLTWDWSVEVDGSPAGSLPGTEMLVGLTPFQGIDVGIDRRSPVVWPVYERHGSFPYSGYLRSVTYTPGEPAPYNPEAVLAALEQARLAAQ